MDQATRAALLAAASNALGPNAGDADDYDVRLRSKALDLALMAADDSNFARDIERISQASKFVAVVDRVTREKTSTRAKVYLKAEGPNGEITEEFIRTERTDEPSGMQMARHIKDNLIGHRCLIWRYMDPIAGNAQGHTSRLLLKIDDLGAPELKAVGQ